MSLHVSRAFYGNDRYKHWNVRSRWFIVVIAHSASRGIVRCKCEGNGNELGELELIKPF